VPENVVLLHGFGGTHRAWDGVASRLDRTRYRVLAFDLPGHGEAAIREGPVTFDSCVRHVLARAPERFTLCGYSMGGRIALQVALCAPERVQSLLLISTSPGIEDRRRRRTRRESDARLADRLERVPYEAFIAYWRSQPLFAADPPWVAQLASADHRRNDPKALAAVLRGIGTGAMRPLWSQLAELRMPVTIVAGARDDEYVAVGRLMVQAMPRAELRILPGGHVLALESPGALAQLLME
jgi:2-succinyl-6-hydroxy-2,4-cyclohexadiene-1-carboxylate synthase